MPRTKSLLRTILEPLAVAVGLAVVARAAVHIYSIPSRSMAPTLEVGDQIVVTRYLRSIPDRGDVIVFRSPRGGDELLVKRVIAVPGDLIDSRFGQVRIGGHTLAEPYVLRTAASGAIESQIVPANSYFVLGDNRDDSIDSRSWGFVPRDAVVGRARLILWSAEMLGAGRASARPAQPLAHVPPRRARLFKWIE
ncbi:MAG TPA: signal peptidase I [Thermoanaerobaculia bacterium]|jgi:signal peptidase I|nr:signal peptidase I [Thermoanaerobaculia bacterium]